MQYKHLFFDMDGTVTFTRSKIDPSMQELLSSLPQDIIIISGSHNDQMSFQMESVPIIKMGQNGNHTINRNGTELWYDKLTTEDKEEIHTHIAKVSAACTYPVPDKNDLIEDRGSQISFSIYGHHADPVEKKAFDGDFKKRKVLLEQFPFESENLEVKLGGSTCFDYFRKGKNKGHNIQRLIDHMQWKKDECIFFGDALFPGGNDEAVIGVIDTVAVEDHLDCYQKLQEMFGNTAK